MLAVCSRGGSGLWSEESLPQPFLPSLHPGAHVRGHQQIYVYTRILDLQSICAHVCELDVVTDNQHIDINRCTSDFCLLANCAYITQCNYLMHTSLRHSTHTKNKRHTARDTRSYQGQQHTQSSKHNSLVLVLEGREKGHAVWIFIRPGIGEIMHVYAGSSVCALMLGDVYVCMVDCIQERTTEKNTETRTIAEKRTITMTETSIKRVPA